MLNWIKNLLVSKTTFLAILIFLDWNEFKLIAPLVIILRTLCGLLSGLLAYAFLCFSWSSSRAIVGFVALNVFMVQYILILFPLSCCNLLIMQRDTSGLTTENRELKLRLQAMEEQAKLRDGMS